MKMSKNLLLLAGLSVPAQALLAGEPAPAVDKFSWACKFCAYEEGVSGHVQAGVGAVSEDSYKFGEHNGLHEEGAYLIGNAIVRSRSDDAGYWNLRALNLGLDTRSVGVDYGRQGSYGLSLDYSELPHRISDTAFTPFLDGGNQVLPPGWVFAPTTGAMTALPASLHEVDIETQRKRVGAGVVLIPSSRWQYGVNFRRETKEGNKRSAGNFSFSSAQFLEPVNYETDQMNATADYAGDRLQARLGYHLSLFRDDWAMSWRNPFEAGTAGTHALPPDNQFHQWLASVGYQVSDNTRVMADVAKGSMRQDVDFLPATTNNALAVALPRGSLDGKVDTLTANLKAVSDLNDRLRVNAAYTYDDRDNKTPQAAYAWVSAESFVNTPRTNLPYSFTHEATRLNADYRFSLGNKLAAGFDRDVHNRSYLEAEETRENAYWLRGKARATSNTDVVLKYTTAQREVSNYQPVAEVFPSQNPLMRKYNMADRDRDAVSARVAIAATERVSLGLGAERTKDDYSASVLGMTRGEENNYSADVAATVAENTSVNLFYNYQHIESDQADSSVFGAPDWLATNEDVVHTAGIGARHQFAGRKLRVGADYTVSQSRGKIRVATVLGESRFPDLVTDLATFKIHATYRLDGGISVNVAYWNEQYDSQDWQLDNVTPTTLPNVLLLGEQSPDYNVNVVMASVRYGF